MPVQTAGARADASGCRSRAETRPTPTCRRGSHPGRARRPAHRPEKSGAVEEGIIPLVVRDENPALLRRNEQLPVIGCSLLMKLPRDNHVVAVLPQRHRSMHAIVCLSCGPMVSALRWSTVRSTCSITVSAMRGAPWSETPQRRSWTGSRTRGCLIQRDSSPQQGSASPSSTQPQGSCVVSPRS